MEIKRLDKEYLLKAMHKSCCRRGRVTSFSNFKMGWEAAIRFAIRVEDAEHVCTQCGKLLKIQEVQYDASGTPFCKKCYEKVFRDEDNNRRGN